MVCVLALLKDIGALLEDIGALLGGAQLPNRLGRHPRLGVLEPFLDLLGLQLDQAFHRGQSIDTTG